MPVHTFRGPGCYRRLAPKHQCEGLVSEMQDELWKTPIAALKGDQGSPEEMAGVSSTPKPMGLCSCGHTSGRGSCSAGRHAGGTPGASGKEMLLLIISKEPDMLEPEVPWAEMPSQHKFTAQWDQTLWIPAQRVVFSLHGVAREQRRCPGDLTSFQLASPF